LKNTVENFKQKTLITFMASACALLMAGPVSSQTIYRIVGADGKVTFSDKQPVTSDKATAIGADGRTLGAGGGSLPFELRQIASKYPVTLYTSSNCGPCSSGRTLLTSRGIPFTEKTITSPEDNAALQRISGESSLPFLTIGGQQLKGFADAEWTQYLDAAGYPKTSALPASYRNPSASPLVAVQKPETAAKPENTERAPATTNQPQVDKASNPAGITF